MGDHAGLANCSFWSALRLKPVAGSVQRMGRSCRVEEALDNHSGADQLGRPRSTPSPSWPPPRRHLRRHGHQLSTKQGVSSSQRCASARSTGVRCTLPKSGISRSSAARRLHQRRAQEAACPRRCKAIEQDQETGCLSSQFTDAALRRMHAVLQSPEC